MEKEDVWSQTSLIVFLLSAVSMVLEFSLVKLFSVLFSYHFSCLAISLVLLGLGLGALLLFFSHQRWPLWDATLVKGSLVLFPASVFLSFFWVSRIQSWGLSFMSHFVLTVVPFLIPFSIIGVAMSYFFSKASRSIGSLYGTDLMGAAAGFLMFMIGLPRVSFSGVVSAMVMMGLGVSVLMLKKGIRRWMGLFLALLVAGGVTAISLNSRLLSFEYSKGGGLADYEKVLWHFMGRLSIGKPNANALAMWALSPHERAQNIPESRFVTIDAGASTVIIRWDGQKESPARFLLKDLSALAYHLSPHRVAVLGSGGGRDVLTAVLTGVQEIYAVDIHPFMNDLVRKTYREYAGFLYDLPSVHPITMDGRAFLEQSRQQYDLIHIPLTDTEAAVSEGAFTLSENYLYTQEALVGFLNHLSPQGVLSICRWITFPPRDSIRVVATAIASLRSLGVSQPQDHIFVATNRKLANVMISKAPFTAGQVSTLSATAQAQGFEVFISPLHVQNNLYGKIYLGLLSDPEAFYKKYLFRIDPSTDHRPFFFHTGKFTKMITHSWGGQNLPSTHFEDSYLFLLILGVVFAGLILLILSMVNRMSRGLYQPGSLTGLRLMIYFICIGIGYIAVEWVLIGRASLILGSPLYGLMSVLIPLLFGSAVGALVSSQGSNTRQACVRVLIVLVLLILLVGSRQNYFQFPFHLRVLGIGFLSCVVGIFLGYPFPLGMRASGLVEGSGLSIMAYGFNMLASVFGSVLATLLALDYGMVFVAVIAASFYGIALLVLDVKTGIFLPLESPRKARGSFNFTSLL